eukprot:COSAG02_NODE_50_length_44860_cov_203.992739_23_plen_129_part_00
MRAQPFTDFLDVSRHGLVLMAVTLVRRLSQLNLSDNPISTGRGNSADYTGLKALLKALGELHDTTLIRDLELVVDNSLRVQVGPELDSARNSFQTRHPEGLLTIGRYDDPTHFFEGELRAPRPVIEHF